MLSDKCELPRTTKEMGRAVIEAGVSGAVAGAVVGKALRFGWDSGRDKKPPKRTKRTKLHDRQWSFQSEGRGPSFT